MDLQQLEARRKGLLRRINAALIRLNDPHLSDEQLRDTNDTVNSLLRQRRRCDASIRKLGGPHYPQSTSNGTSIKGHLYFGRAKELPDVQILLQEAERERKEFNSKNSDENRLNNFRNAKLPDSYPINIDYESIKSNNEGLTRLNFTNTPDVQAFIIKKKKELLLKRLKS